MMATDDFLAIPVEVLAVDVSWVTVRPVNEVADCPQCQAGQGCGQNPWFRGLLGQKPLRLPRGCADAAQLRLPSYAELCLPNRVLTRLTLLAYGLPLLVFLLVLVVGQAWAAWLQFLLAVLLAGVVVWWGKTLALRWIFRDLRLMLC